MTTLARWWAPQNAGIGPDFTDLALLTAAGDGPRDLGQALLALHRIGAAACEAVATQPLADESTLGFALANARKLAVPPAMEAVSKALGDGSYAGLLLRDTLDDAEAAAVSLWRTCLAKGMAPVTAAKRVGAVYGVPIRELGRYTVLASDPKTRPEVAEHAADKALFDFVAKYVAEEGVETKVTVSKAPMVTEGQTLTGDAYLEQHHVARDDTGEFVSEGLVGRRAVPRRTLSRRTLKRRELSAVGQTKSAQKLTGLARSGQQRSQMAKVKLTRGQQKLAALLEQHERPLQAAPNLSGVPRPVPDLLSRRPEMPGSQHLWKPVSFVMSNDEWAELASGMGVAPDGRRVLRTGGLVDYLGKPVLHEEEGVISPEHEYAVQHVAGLINDRPEFRKAPPRVVRVLHKAVAGDRLLISASTLHEAKLKLLKDYQDDHGVTLNLDREIKYVDAAMDSINHDDLVLVYTPPTPGMAKEDRLFRAVVEVFVDLEATRGHEDVTRSVADVNLDPNAPLSAPANLGGLSGRFFQRDVDGGTFRIQVTMDEAEEADIVQAKKSQDRKRPFGKALTTVRFAQLEEQGLIDRDETGEFVSPGAPREINRRSLNRRSVSRRTLPIATASQQRTAMVQSGQAKTDQQRTAMSQSQMARIAQVAAKHQSEQAQSVYLDDSFDYTVLTRKDLGRVIEGTEAHYLEQMYDQDVPFSLEAQLGIKERHRLMPGQMGIVDAKQARLELIGEAENEWVAQSLHGGIWTAPLLSRRAFDDSDMEEIGAALDTYLADHPKVQRLHLLIGKDESSGDYVITVRGNRQPMEEVHLVRWHDAIGQPLLLQPEGTKRLLDKDGLVALLKMRFHRTAGNFAAQPGSEDTITNPLVFTWSAVAKPEQP